MKCKWHIKTVFKTIKLMSKLNLAVDILLELLRGYLQSLYILFKLTMHVCLFYYRNINDRVSCDLSKNKNK